LPTSMFRATCNIFEKFSTDSIDKTAIAQDEPWY